MNNKLNATTFKPLNSSKTTKTFIVFMILVLGLSSCSVTKCRYSNGFKMDLNIARKEKQTETKAKIAEKKQSISLVKDIAFVKPEILEGMPSSIISIPAKNTNEGTNNDNTLFNTQIEKSNIKSKKYNEYNTSKKLTNHKKLDNKFKNQELKNSSSCSSALEDALFGYFLIAFLIMIILVATGTLPYIIAFFTSDGFLLVMEILGLIFGFILCSIF